MPSESEARSCAGGTIIFIVALALYFIAYFPVMSCVARHHLPVNILYAWEPLPQPVLQRMFFSWVKIDPSGEAGLRFLR